ncbi:MAG: hypothetical protein K6E60_03800 [Saccharofermentans sp.]|nr:hypothetical protein [Saccharofermentans sp.]
MMTHSQIKVFVTEALLLAIVSAALIIGGFLWSNERADKRLQREYRQKFGTVLPAESYTPLTGRVLNDFPEINSVYRGYDKDGTPIGYVFDMTVVMPSDKSTKLDFRIGIDFETSRVTGLMCEDPKIDRRLKYLESTLKGKQIPVAFRRADTTVSDDETYAPVEGLKDGIYYAQRLIDDRSKFVDYVEMEVKGGKITRVNWDAFNLDMTTEDRSYASLSGAYEISGLDWAVQSYNICHALLKLQDPDRLAMKSDGTTSIIDGVTCSIQCFVDLSKECINNSREGYTKDKYLAAINRIYTETMGSTPDADGVRNKAGYIAFSFEKTPEVYTIYDDSGSARGFRTVREIEAIMNGKSISNRLTPTPTPSPEATPDPQNDMRNADKGAEDGYAKGSSEDEQTLTDSIDDLPMSEVATYIYPPSDSYVETRLAIRAFNTGYKFLKAYLNWRV